VRIPWYIVVLSCLIATGLTLWLGVRKYDFSTPPTAAELAELDADARKRYGLPEKASPPPVTPPLVDKQPNKPTTGPDPVEPTKKLALPDTSIRPGLDSLRDSARTADDFALLAQQLEQAKAPEYALLAWERMLDQTDPSPELVQKALGHIQQLRPPLPPWNLDPRSDIPLKLCASVPSDLQQKMTAILTVAAEDIEEASGFTLKVTPSVSVVAIKDGKPRPSVSIWLQGKRETPRLSFKTRSAIEPSIDVRTQSSIFSLVVSQIDKTDLTCIQELPTDTPPLSTLRYLITRLSWKTVGEMLNR